MNFIFPHLRKLYMYNMQNQWAISNLNLIERDEYILVVHEYIFLDNYNEWQSNYRNISNAIRDSSHGRIFFIYSVVFTYYAFARKLYNKKVSGLANLLNVQENATRTIKSPTQGQYFPRSPDIFVL